MNVNRVVIENQPPDSEGAVFYVTEESKMHLKDLNVMSYGGIVMVSNVYENTILIEDSTFEDVHQFVI